MREGPSMSRRPGRGHSRSRARDDSRHSILERIEEKLSRLLGDTDDPDPPPGTFEPEATWDEGDIEPRLLGGPHASAPVWDPSLAGPRFDRLDVGSVGTHGVHPVSVAALGGPAGYRSTAREHYLAMRASRQAPAAGGELHRDYTSWRDDQIEALDRAYEEYCRERNESFAQEFGDWRARRQDQRQALARVTENMEVIGSDGECVGRVEAVAAAAIAVAWEDAGGRTLAGQLPYSWIQSVGAEVVVDRPAADARAKMKPSEAESRPHPAPAST